MQVSFTSLRGDGQKKKMQFVDMLHNSYFPHIDTESVCNNYQHALNFEMCLTSFAKTQKCLRN